MKGNRLRSGLIFSYAAIIVQGLVSILYTPALLRLLGESDYGLLQLAVSTIANLTILSFGFTGSYMRFYAPYRANKDTASEARLNGTFLILFLLAALLALIAGGIITASADTVFSHSMTADETAALKALLAVMTVNMALTLVSNVFDVYISAQERFTFLKLSSILASLAAPVVIIPFLIAGHGSIAAAVCTTVITAAKLSANAVYCIKRLGMRFKLCIDLPLIRRLSAFSFFVFLNIISDQINWNADKTILGIMRGAGSVTLYSLGAQLNSYFLMFSYALSSVLTPRAHTLAAEGRDDSALTRFFTRFGRLEFAVMMYIFMVFVCVGKPFMRLWSGLPDDIPYYTALILITPVLLTSAQSIGIEIQRAKDLHRFRSVVYILIAVFNILISIPLCARFGELGCAAGTGLCLIIGNIFIMNVYYHKRVGLDIIYFWRNILRLVPSLILPAAAAVIVRRFTGGGIAGIAAGAAVVTAVYIPSVYLLGLNSKERAKLRRGAKK